MFALLDNSYSCGESSYLSLCAPIPFVPSSGTSGTGASSSNPSSNTGANTNTGANSGTSSPATGSTTSSGSALLPAVVPLVVLCALLFFVLINESAYLLDFFTYEFILNTLKSKLSGANLATKAITFFFLSVLRSDARSYNVHKLNICCSQINKIFEKREGRKIQEIRLDYFRGLIGSCFPVIQWLALNRKCRASICNLNQRKSIVFEK